MLKRLPILFEIHEHVNHLIILFKMIKQLLASNYPRGPVCLSFSTSRTSTVRVSSQRKPGKLCYKLTQFALLSNTLHFGNWGHLRHFGFNLVGSTASYIWCSSFLIWGSVLLNSQLPRVAVVRNRMICLVSVGLFLNPNNKRITLTQTWKTVLFACV